MKLMHDVGCNRTRKLRVTIVYVQTRTAIVLVVWRIAYIVQVISLIVFYTEHSADVNIVLEERVQ